MASIGILVAALVILVATKADPLPVLGLGAAVAVALSLLGVPLA
jgi:hypothetical protein